MNIVGHIKYALGEDYAQIKFSETRDTLSIDTVVVPVSHRGQGIGTFLIDHILILADEQGKDVLLSARPIGAVNDEKVQKLVRFYQKFGFEVYDRGLTVAYMRRKAKAGGKA